MFCVFHDVNFYIISLFVFFFLKSQSKYCTLVNKPEDKYKVPNGFSVLSELPEATSAVLDSRVISALNKFSHLIDYIHISDQYTGAIQQEDPSSLKQPDVKKMLLAGFNLPPANDMEAAKPLLVLMFYIIERLKRFRLSKEVSVAHFSLIYLAKHTKLKIVCFVPGKK